MKRVRYTDEVDFIVSKPIFCQNENYKVFIKKADFSVTIQNSKHNVVELVTTDNMAAAKKAAKLGLTKLGAVFYAEVRGKVVI